MIFNKITSKHKNLIFIIEEDFPEIGTYLYVYENGKCIKDSLQDNISTCKEFAFEEYGVPTESWKEK